MPTPPHNSNGSDDMHARVNGVKHEQDDADADADADGDLDEIQVSTVPSKKRTSSMVEDEDARLARELQAQEEQMARGRQTRGGRAAPSRPKSKKKKSSAKVKAADDSDLDTEDSGATKKRKAGGGFQKEFDLSFPLAELVGSERVCTSRSQRPERKDLLTISIAVPAPGRQEVVGAHQGQRPAGAQ